MNFPLKWKAENKPPMMCRACREMFKRESPAQRYCEKPECQEAKKRRAEQIALKARLKWLEKRKNDRA